MIRYASMIEFLKKALDTDDIVYGYPKRALEVNSDFNKDALYYSYQYVQKDIRSGVGQRLLSSNELYSVSIQAAQASTCVNKINDIIKATEGANVQFVSSSLRKDTLVEIGYIASVVLYLYKGNEDFK